MQKPDLYFDYASTAPLDPRVFRAMRPYFTAEFGNPANLYKLGHRSKKAVAAAREKITAALNCSPQEFVFTGSATEADNLALLGAARANREFGNSPRTFPQGTESHGKVRGKIIVSAIEHKGILAAAHALSKEGFEVAELPVGRDGLVRLADLTKLLDEKTILVSITYADNETGTIQPTSKISELIRNFRSGISNSKFLISKKLPNYPIIPLPNYYPLFHTDATQAALYLDLDVEKLGVDLLTLSAHKIYGPKGIGGLYVRKGVKIQPIIHGGGQQEGLRSGTENLPGIVGFGEAMAIVQKEKKKENARVRKLRDKLEQGILKRIPKVVLNGHPEQRLPNFLNVSILDIEGEAMLLYLDEKGIYVNTGSACNSQSLNPSHVLMAMGQPYEYIHGSLRFSLGKFTTAASVDYVLKHLPAIVEKLRRASPLKLELNQKEKISRPEAFIGNQTPHFLRKRK